MKIKRSLQRDLKNSLRKIKNQRKIKMKRNLKKIKKKKTKLKRKMLTIRKKRKSQRATKEMHFKRRFSRKMDHQSQKDGEEFYWPWQLVGTCTTTRSQ